jgi:hypothetical protein
MDRNCSECQTIAGQLRAALAELVRSPSRSSLSREDIRASLSELFASEEKIARLGDSFRNSSAGQAYARWTEHRIATGHTGSAIMPSFN